MKEKYKGANENFITMLYRYNIVMNVLNYSQEIHPKKLSDGGLVDILRKMPYSESIERLIVLYSYGVIDEQALRFLTVSYPLPIDAAEAAENTVISNERAVKDNDDISTDIDDNGMLIEKVLKICAVAHNTAELIYTDFSSLYKGFLDNQKHILTVNGYCYPSPTLLCFLGEYNYTLVRCDAQSGRCEPIEEGYEYTAYSLDELEEALLKYEGASDEKQRKYDELICSVPVIRDISAVLTYTRYLDKLYGTDFLRYCINNNISIDSELLYDDYIKNKKLRFEFIAYTKKRSICGSKINHFDYDIIETSEGRIIRQESVSDKELSWMCQLELSDVSENDTSEQLIAKALKKYINKMPPDGLVVQTVLDDMPVMYMYISSTASFVKLDYDYFHKELFDYEKVLGFVKVCSEKHLIRTTADDNVQIILVSGDKNYAEMYDMNDNELSAAKNVIREQLAKRNVLNKRKTAELRNMTQLKIEAEEAVRRTEQEKARKEAEKEQARLEKQAKRNKRNTSDESE